MPMNEPEQCSHLAFSQKMTARLCNSDKQNKDLLNLALEKKKRHIASMSLLYLHNHLGKEQKSHFKCRTKIRVKKQNVLSEEMKVTQIKMDDRKVNGVGGITGKDSESKM